MWTHDNTTTNAAGQWEALAAGLRTRDVPSGNSTSTSSKDVRRACSLLMRDTAITIAEILEAELCSVAQVVQNGAMLETEVYQADGNADNSTPLRARTAALHAATSLVGYALGTTRPAVTSNHSVEKRFRDELLDELSVTRSLVLPLRLNGEPFGALGIHRKTKQKFIREEVQCASTIAELLTSLVVRLNAETASRDGAETTGEPSSTASDRAPKPAKPQAVGRVADLRASPRQVHMRTLMIAPAVDNFTPLRQGFFEVTCYDICRGGLSFYLDSPPDFDRLVVELGSSRNATHLRAAVVHSRKIEYNGQMKYVVGCKFIGRAYI